MDEEYEHGSELSMDNEMSPSRGVMSNISDIPTDQILVTVFFTSDLVLTFLG